MLSFNQISHSYQGGVAKNQQQILQGRPYSFKRVPHAYSILVYHMFKQWLIALRFKDAHSSNYNIFKRRAVRCLGRRSHYAFRKMMCNCEGHVLRAYTYHVFLI